MVRRIVILSEAKDLKMRCGEPCGSHGKPSDANAPEPQHG
jgi:hypothetical protein